MRSTFYGFEIARTGLYASQLNIDLTGHNIANANTVGYTRQRLNMSSRELVSGGVRFKEVITGYSGAGVRTDGIEQVRSDFLDRQYRRENASQQQWTTRADGLGYIETLFSNTGKGSLTSTIDAFFSSVQSLTQNPESKEYRTNMMQNALKMTDTFNHLHSQLNDKLLDQNNAVKTVADQINDIARNLADMNDQIYRFEISGDIAVDLRDQRNLLLDKLSGLADMSYSEGSDGKMTVTVGGHMLVDHLSYNQIVSAQTGHMLVDHLSYNQIVSAQTVANPVSGANDFYGLTWSDDSSAVSVSSGQLQAFLDLRDGATAANPGIPYLIDRLNTLASAIATEFNAIHADGYTLPDGVTPSAAGGNFFAVPALGPITAANFTVDAAIQSNVYLIAASSELITTDVLKGNNKNALEMIRLQSRLDLPGIGSIEGYLKGFLSEIGVEANHTYTMRDGEQTLVDSIETQRQSLSGVSIDEETTNLIKFQHAYSANARVITTIDEYLDVLINKMGLVGR